MDGRSLRLRRTLESGPVTMRGVPLTAKGEFEPIPSFYALVRRRAPRA